MTSLPQRTLIVLQAALSLVLLVGAGLRAKAPFISGAERKAEALIHIGRFRIGACRLRIYFA
jgi:hypothetical protein